MSSHIDIVQNSVRTKGRDTIAIKKTGFLDTSVHSPAPPPGEPKYEMWTDELNVRSRARREERGNRVKPTPVADVPDFDLETHLREAEKEKAREKSKWKLW